MSGSYAYVADGPGGLQVIDISKRAQPKIVGAAATPGDAKGVSVAWPYAYIADDAQGIQVIDITEASNPKIVGSLLTSGTCQAVFLVYPLLFVAADVDGLRVVDVSNPKAPVLLGTEFTSGYALGVYVTESLAYMADYDIGLELIDVRKYFSHIVATVDTPGNALDVKVSGSYAYVADDAGGLQVIDVGKPAAPTIVGSLATTGNAQGIHVSGSYAYVAEDLAGLQVINIDTPQSPFAVGSITLPGQARGVFVSGSCAYVAAGSDGGLQVIDVGDPENPVVIGAVATPGSAESVRVVGSQAFVADGSAGGLQVIDVNNPQSPTIIGSLSTWGTCYELDVSGTLAYVADGLNGLTVVDLGDLNNPIPIGGYETDSSASGIRVAGLYAFLATTTDGLSIFDISEPAEPFPIVTVNTPGTAYKVELSGSYGFIADGVKGLQVIALSNFPCDQQPPEIPSSISYPASDGDGIFTVSWPSALRAETYNVQRANNSLFTGAISVYDGPATLFQQSNLFTGTFYYRVRALNDCGASGWKTGGAISVTSFPPRPNSISYAASSCGGSLAITWTSSVGATAYLVQRASNISFTDAIDRYAGPSTSFTDSSLTYGTYYYRVRASNGYGTSPWKTGGATTVPPPPAVPASITYPAKTCSGNLTVTWALASGATGYTLQRATKVDFSDATQVYLGASNSYTEPGLSPGTYYYRVQANNSCGSSTWKSGSASVVPPAPPAPASISYPASSCGGNFTVSWAAVTDAVSYTLQRDTSAAFTSPVENTTSSLSYSQGALSAGSYFFRVRANTACGSGAWQTGPASAVLAAPPAPDGITYPGSSCNGNFTVTWPGVAEATAYVLQRATNASFTDAAQIYSGAATSYSQGALDPGVYYYRVQGSNTCGSGTWKAGAAVTVTTTPPTPGTLTYPAKTCSGNLTVAWTLASGATGYTLQRATTDAFSDATQVYLGASNSYTEPSLAPGTYYYRVQANNGCGSSAWKNGVATVVTPAPPAPGSISYPASSCGGNFTVSWAAVTDAVSYTLQRDTSAAFSSPVENTTTSTSFNQGALSAGSYFFRVRANTVCGSGAWQTGPAVAVLAAPPAPAGITYPGSSCDGNFTVTWQSVAEATSYVLQRATNADVYRRRPVYTGTATSYLSGRPRSGRLLLPGSRKQHLWHRQLEGWRRGYRDHQPSDSGKLPPTLRTTVAEVTRLAGPRLPGQPATPCSGQRMPRSPIPLPFIVVPISLIRNRVLPQEFTITGFRPVIRAAAALGKAARPSR